MSEMTREHLEAVQAAIALLRQHSSDIAREVGCSSDGSVERKRSKRAKAALKPISRLAEVAAMIEAKLEEKP